MRSLSIHLVVRLVLAMACSAIPVLAHAQEPPPKPVRGWFGSGRSGPGEGQALILTGGVSETFDGERNTSYPDYQAGIRYDRKSRNRALSVIAGTTSRHFAGFGGLSTTTHDVAAGFATSLGRRTRLHLEHSASTSPYYMVTVFEPPVLAELTLGPQAVAEAPPPEPAIDHAVLRRKASSMASELALTHSLGRHTAVTLSYGLAQSHTDDSDFRASYVGASFNHHLGRYAIARARYGRRLTDRHGLSAPDGPGIATSHDVDLGVDYNRPLSLSRRTTMVITTGSAIVPAAELLPGATGARYRMLGTAALNHAIGRTWKTSVSYGRNLEFVETFTEPLLSDSVALNLGGRFNRKLDLAVSANFSTGSVGFASGDAANGYGIYSGSARLRWAINRVVTGYGEYVAYGHVFDSGVQVPQGFGRDVKQSEIRVGLTVSAPLIR